MFAHNTGECNPQRAHGSDLEGVPDPRPTGRYTSLHGVATQSHTNCMTSWGGPSRLGDLMCRVGVFGSPL